MPLLPQRTELPRLLKHPRQFARAYRISIIILLSGGTADFLRTYHNLRLYGASVEAHPVQRWVSETIGVTAGVPAAKIFQVSFVLLVAAWWKPWTAPLLTLCGLLYLAAAVSNYFLLL